MPGITLIVDRKTGDLWLQHDGSHFEVMWDVTGVKRNTEELFRSVRIFRRGEQIGIVWHVGEIRERWG